MIYQKLGSTALVKTMKRCVLFFSSELSGPSHAYLEIAERTRDLRLGFGSRRSSNLVDLKPTVRYPINQVVLSELSGYYCD